MAGFKQLVSQLSISPQASGGLRFYFRRLVKERLTRQLSGVFAVLLIGLQIATMVAPAQSSNAASCNDIVLGGVTSVSQVLNIYDNGMSGCVNSTAAQVQAMFSTFGISRSDLANMHFGTVNSVTTLSPQGWILWSLGREHAFANDQVYNIAGETYYLRPLKDWDTGTNVTNGSTYPAFIGTRSVDGQEFAILQGCGNIAVFSVPPAPTAPASPGLSAPNKTTLPNYPVAGSTVTRGENLGYRIYWNNNGNGAATNVQLVDHLPPDTTWVFGSPMIGNQLVETWASMPAGAQNWYADFIVQVANTAINGEEICNTAYLSAAGVATMASQQICFTVSVPAAPPPPTSPNITQSKSALDLTQLTNGQPTNATTITAQPGDYIQYTLTTSNTGNGASSNYVVSDQIPYILQYANLTNPNGATLNASTDTISWPAETIPAGGKVTDTFTVQVKNPIPSTPQGTSDPNSFNLKMTNVYGNQIVIPVATPLPKQVEAASASLPQTGAGNDALIVLTFCALVVYFWTRNRQLLKEVKVLRQDYHGGGS